MSVEVNLSRPLRADWMQKLEARVGQKLNLKPEAQSELKKLQDAAEQVESIFVKQLMSTMRQSAMAEKPQGMSELAYDFMDDSVAKSVSRSRGTFGLAEGIFLATAVPIAQTRQVPVTTQSPESQASTTQN